MTDADGVLINIKHTFLKIRFTPQVMVNQDSNPKQIEYKPLHSCQHCWSDKKNKIKSQIKKLKKTHLLH